MIDNPTEEKGANLEPLLFNGAPGGVLTKDLVDQHSKIIILIHGFTSHCSELVEFASKLYVLCEGYLIINFNYNSYNGIDYAAKVLDDNLRRIDGFLDNILLKKDIYLITHSMGGLVAREFLLTGDNRNVAKALVMLGTPNRGTLNHKVAEYFFRLHWATNNPIFGIRQYCLSAKQLTLQDDTLLIESINERWRQVEDMIPTLTVSGGRKELKLHDNKLKNYFFNRLLQSILDGRPNDGLVPEESVNLELDPTVKHAGHRYQHENNYTEFNYINHTNLTNNEAVLYLVATWITKLAN